MKIGFMGGSFDPVHFGHLVAAQDAYEHGGLDRLVFVPAAQAPLKPGAVRASADARLTMLHAAVSTDARFEISDHEIRKGGISYTIDTVRYLRTQFPDDELAWVIGADQLERLHLWREIGELVKLVEFIVLARPGWPKSERTDIAGLRLRWCQGHLLEVSSTEVRERIATGLPVDFLIPHKTVEYIEKTGLYRSI
ncbi:nicotinate-nucleotide adenylyltransferase [Rariglobus hedericola]|uniref:Probable nicotinate-nucleotide adenylyltransferase n=1 Tax=Rariglobus hedericola TaxID=2597822 RepID=A0A556QRU7_9BACT|nr:nicotinate-nucleotide adenylyltransferase [Rariglobus hedericola]TSJ79364.1 nicotinate-nucleotide adenylyltransferase [Rariglobus hedericola]